jgi:hypothetical protein
MTTEREGELNFCRYRRCRWTGKVLDAHDYGHKAWPIGSNKKRRK